MTELLVAEPDEIRYCTPLGRPCGGLSWLSIVGIASDNPGASRQASFWALDSRQQYMYTEMPCSVAKPSENGTADVWSAILALASTK